MIDVWRYDGLNVIVKTKDGRLYEGICSAGTDYKTNMDYLDFNMPNNAIHEIDADEIESIRNINLQI